MVKTLKCSLIIIIGLFLFCSFADAKNLNENFASPPPVCGAYWFWHTKASEEGITRDLEAMKEQGIKDLLVFPFDEYMKPEWIPIFEHTLSEAQRLNLRITINNAPGWMCKAPWITPELAEKRIVCNERVLNGAQHITNTLPCPAGEASFYRDIIVLACRLGEKPSGRSTQDAVERQSKTARSMRPYNAAGDLDIFYKKSTESTNDEIIAPGAVLDISAQMQADGSLDWEAPPGRWIVQRFGYTVMKSQGNRTDLLSPDFFSRESLDYHLRESIEKLIPIVGKYIGTSWTHVLEDSYEDGAQTWTPAFRQEFSNRRGYDMTPWLPTLAGRVVGSRAVSDRFLHDYRQTISDLYAENHFGYFAKRLSDLSLHYTTEGGYGWASPIADGLRIEAISEIPMGECWHPQRQQVTGEWLEFQFKVSHLDMTNSIDYRGIPYGLGMNSIRLAASAAHIYGKPYCQAETFTSYTKGGSNSPNGYDLCNPPFSIKTTADRAFCDGLGRVVYAVYDLQSGTDEKPGYVWIGVGEHLSRKLTWWNQLHALSDYLSRCQLMFQQGKFVADFAYWTGDTIPYECPDRLAMRPALPRGCNADLVNTDVLMNRITVKDGRLILPDGISYRYLVMPPTRDTVEPGSLRKIKEFIEAGATVILGPRPVSAAGLGNYPQCDNEIKELANAIWGAMSATAGERQLGKGRVVWGRELAEQLAVDGIEPDFKIIGAEATDDFEWIHYRSGDADIYFIANQTERDETVELGFRVSGKLPVLWDPVWGTQRSLPEYRFDKNVTAVPMRFAAKQSWFLIFNPRTAAVPKHAATHNFPATRSILDISKSWEISFDPAWGGPPSITFDELEDWTKRPEEGIKFYSGTATYRKTFDLPKNVPTNHLYLDLGMVKDLAEVRLNGSRLGVIWTAPWRIDVSGAVRETGNQLEIDVINQWPNRLIGDSRLPADKRLTKSNYKLKPDDPLLPSGLLGPVRLSAEE